MNEFRLSAAAEDDLTDIWNYLEERSEQSANALIESLVKRFVMLCTFQEAGRDRDELKPGLKSFPIDRYIIFYRIIPEGIEIIRVLHGARDIEQIFSEQPTEHPGDLAGKED